MDTGAGGGYDTAVITISRGSFSGGMMLAECLCKRLGYRCVGREEIVARAAGYGVSARELEDAMEKPPSFLERFRHKKYLYLAVVQAALTEEVRSGRTVYHGHAGHLLLGGGGPVLRVRVVAPMEFRIQQVQERLGLKRGKAIHYIHKMDEERQKWTQFLYGVDWKDPSIYDLVINLEHIDITVACENVVTTIQNQECFQFGPESQKAMANLARASRAKVELALDPSTADLELELTADGGLVSVAGKLPRPEQLRDIQRVILGVEGVTSVNYDRISWPIPD